MAWYTQREICKFLEECDQLAHITVPVSPNLQIKEITDRVIKAAPHKNKSLLFENVIGSEIPVLINTLGIPQRIAWMLEVGELDDLIQQLSKLIDLQLTHGLFVRLSRGYDLLNLLKSIGLGSKKVRYAPFQEVIEFDRHYGLQAIPVRFGVDLALRLSTFCYVPTVLSLLSLEFILNLGWLYWMGLLLVTGLLIWVHSLVKPGDLSRINVAFFNLNGYISVSLFLAIFSSLYLSRF